ncbi:MAG: hypothetical protein IBJ14_16200 [Hydrogenophaga sp.]|nr:hypothetical protein [Hydrogenophaga sp.]
MDIARIHHRHGFYCYGHISGPTAVLVSVRFGKAPPVGPTVVTLPPVDSSKHGAQLDVSNHVDEVLRGVRRASEETGASLEVEAIEVVPDDYPSKGQAEYVAYRIALAVANKLVGEA